MPKDLTNFQVDRQIILNNELAISEIQKTSKINCVFFEQKLYLTKEMVADFFEVDIRTIERYISSFSDKLKENGYTVLKGKKLKDFFKAFSEHCGTDINVGTTTTVITHLPAFIVYIQHGESSVNAWFSTLSLCI